MKLQGLEVWDRLGNNDLYFNNVRRAGASQHLREFQERLERKRYISNDTADVRVVLPCCRPPDLRCSRAMRRSGSFCVRTQYLGARISRLSSQREITHRN
jgi:hypothetical protein